MWCVIESVWYVSHSVGRTLVARGIWDLRGQSEEIGTEERWRLWISMLESAPDPWQWLGSAFLVPGAKTAPTGASDNAVTGVRIEHVGRTNVEQFIAHFMIGINLERMKPKSLERAEVHAMCLLLELALSQHRGAEFRFLKGKSPHHVFLINDQPMITGHHPMIFYCGTAIASELGNLALYLGGFRFYGKPSSSVCPHAVLSALPGLTALLSHRTQWPFPPYFMHASRRALEKLADPVEVEKMAPNEDLANQLSYWYRPASRKMLEQNATPIVFCKQPMLDEPAPPGSSG